MKQYDIKTYNNIAIEGLQKLDRNRYVLNDSDDPEGVILRSYNLHERPINPSLLGVARAGAGYNNIPVDELSEEGIVVFNTPGANANSVKELVIASMIVHARSMIDANHWSNELTGPDIATQVEDGKKMFKGTELQGKTMGVIGLGSIGHLVANDAYELGMDVIGYDPYISVEAAWKINRYVDQAESMEEVLQKVDYLSIHVPVTDETRGLIDKAALRIMKNDAVLLNFSRTELVDIDAVLKALDNGDLGHYITDFPDEKTVGHEKCLLFPHLGASTEEAETNCAVMAARQLRQFLETGDIVNSVNYPRVQLRLTSPIRIAICNLNVQNIIAKLTNLLSEQNINIDRFINKSRGKYAYTLVDISETDEGVLEDLLKSFTQIDGILKARIIRNYKHEKMR